MTKTYLLIDLQNRQPAPESVASWMGANGEAWVFYGEQEIGLLARYMELGDQVSLVDISRPGKNFSTSCSVWATWSAGTSRVTLCDRRGGWGLRPGDRR